MEEHPIACLATSDFLRLKAESEAFRRVLKEIFDSIDCKQRDGKITLREFVAALQQKDSSSDAYPRLVSRILGVPIVENQRIGKDDAVKLFNAIDDEA